MLYLLGSELDFADAGIQLEQLLVQRELSHVGTLMMARVDVFEDDHAYASPLVAVALHAVLEEFERVDVAEESGRLAVI